MNYKDFEEFLSNREFSFHRVQTLIFLLILACFSLMTVIIPFIGTYTVNIYIHLFVFLLVLGLIVFYWYRYRVKFPKCKNSKENIVVAIVTENAKQKVRIANDFTNQIKKQILANNLGNYDVVVLHNYQSKVLQEKIRLYNDSIISGIESVDIDKFFHLAKRLNARFIIYGNLIQRNCEDTTYALNIEASIMHSVTNKENQNVLNNEFRKVWDNEISFLEKEELTGFKTNANQVFFAASYMLGLATFVDNNYIKGIQIWESLEKYIAKNPELESYLKNAKTLKSVSYFLQSRYLYLIGKIEESIDYRKRYLALVPNEYDTYLIESVKQITVRNDVELALEFNDKARKIAPSDDGTWRYNNMYLYIKLPNAIEALKSLDEILNTSYKIEFETIRHIFSYNVSCLQNDPSHIQTYFILGVIRYKKLNDPILAYEELENFVNKNTNHEWILLVERSKKYLKEIDEILQINQ
jgi:hypothetical protein